MPFHWSIHKNQHYCSKDESYLHKVMDSMQNLLLYKKNAHFLTCPDRQYGKSYLSLESISNDKKCTEPYVHSLKEKQNLYVSNIPLNESSNS